MKKTHIFVKNGIVLADEDVVLLCTNPSVSDPMAYDTVRRLLPTVGNAADYPPHLVLEMMDDLIAHDGDDRWWAELIRSQIGDALGDPATVMVCPLIYAGKVGDPRMTWDCV